MKRRDFLASLPLAAGAPYLGAVLGLSLSACGKEVQAGPAAINWDRDACERCGMILSDRLFAAQIRDPQKKVHKFDDFGCAVFTLEKQGWPLDQSEFWVADARDGRWLDARQAHYVGGKRTPMLYGFGAVAEAPAGAEGLVSFAEARQQILAKGK